MPPSVIYLFSYLRTETAFMVIVQFRGLLVRQSRTGLVSLILLGWDLHILYHCTMCTRYRDLVSLDFPHYNFISLDFPHYNFIYLSPLIFKHNPNLLIILVQVSSNAKKYYILYR